jgi:hypothetical protein
MLDCVVMKLSAGGHRTKPFDSVGVVLANLLEVIVTHVEDEVLSLERVEGVTRL